MWEFIINHWWILLTIYAAGAVVTFSVTAALLIYAVIAEDDEYIYSDPEHYKPSRVEYALGILICLFMAALIALLWIGLPVIFAGVTLFDVLGNKFPQLMGGMNDEDDKEE